MKNIFFFLIYFNVTLLSCKTRTLNTDASSSLQSQSPACSETIALFNEKISEAQTQLNEASHYASQTSSLMAAVTSELLKVRDGFSQMRSDHTYVPWYLSNANTASSYLNQAWSAASGIYTHTAKLSDLFDKALLNNAETVCDSSEKKTAILNFKYQFFNCPNDAIQATHQADYVTKAIDLTNQQLKYVINTLGRAQGVENVDDRLTYLSEAQSALVAVTTARLSTLNEISKAVQQLSQIGSACVANLN